MNLKFVKGVGRIEIFNNAANNAFEICTKCILSKFALLFIYTVIERNPGCSDGVIPETVGLVSVYPVSPSRQVLHIIFRLTLRVYLPFLLILLLFVVRISVC